MLIQTPSQLRRLPPSSPTHTNYRYTHNHSAALGTARPQPCGNYKWCRCLFRCVHHGSGRVHGVVRTGKEGDARLCSLTLPLPFSLSPVRPSSPRHILYQNQSDALRVPLKASGGFLFNGARRGSAPAVCLINAAPTAAPLPPACLLLPTTVMDGTAVGRFFCVVWRKLFLAECIGVNTKSSPLSYLYSPSSVFVLPPII